MWLFQASRIIIQLKGSQETFLRIGPSVYRGKGIGAERVWGQGISPEGGEKGGRRRFTVRADVMYKRVCVCVCVQDPRGRKAGGRTGRGHERVMGKAALALRGSRGLAARPHPCCSGEVERWRGAAGGCEALPPRDGN